MNPEMPAGWGFCKPGQAKPFQRVAGPPVTAVLKATRKRGSNDRRMHMKFALWAAGLNREPLPSEVCSTFGVCYESARRLLLDWKKINEVKA